MVCRTTPVLLALVALLALGAVPSRADDDGPGTIKLDDRRVDVEESAGMATLAVERDDGSEGAVSVEYATSGGTATEAADYTAVSGTLSWEDGEDGDKLINVPILDDAEDEDDEEILLILRNPTGGATLLPSHANAVIVIEDDDGDDGDDGDHGDHGDDHNGSGKLKFDQRGFKALENSGTAVITVERDDGSQGAVTVDYATSDGTATDGDDYTGTAGTLSWEDGEEGMKSFTVDILEDGVHEPSETVRLTLSNPTGGATLHGHNAILVIRDNDHPGDDGSDDEEGPGVFKFEHRGFQVLEDQLEAVIEVERDDGEEGTVSVDYATGDGSATDGEDYTGAAGTLSWGDGEDGSQTFTIPVLEDDLEEGDETVLLTLSNPTGGATVDDEEGEAELTIVDNDGQTTACVPDDSTLCLLGDRFQVQVVWRTRQGKTGLAHAVPVSPNTGLFWFFDEDNIEMLLKVLDTCGSPIFEAYWVFFAATTNVDFTVTVTDTATGVVKQYLNPSGQAAEPVQDTFTFKTCN